MDFQYNVSRNYNRINFQNIFGMQFLPSALKEIYDAVVKRSYKDLILDFSGLEAAFADGMVPLCSYVRYIKEEYNVSIEYVAPNSLRLNRIFVNANWAHLIDSTARESKYSGYKQFPATIVNDDDDLSSVVNSVLDCVLRACLETHLSIMKRFNSMLAMAI